MATQGLNADVTPKTPKKISLADIKNSRSVFVGKPVLEVVEWSQDGEEYQLDVWVRRYGYATAVSDLAAIRSGDDMAHTARRIAESVVDEGGEPVFTVEDITGESDPERGAMSQPFVLALLGAIYRTNALGKS